MSILMYLLPALGVVLIARAYWRMERDERAVRVKEWEEFRRGDDRVSAGTRLIRVVAWLFAIWRVLLLAGVMAFIGLVLATASMEWKRAPWRLPLTLILVTAGLCAWVFGKSFDPANGRRRCPKCWYDYSALGGTDKCPECGHEPRNLAELHKARPSRGWMMAAPALLVMAYLAHMVPIVARTSWRSFVPTDVLIWGYDVLPDTLIVGPEAGSLVSRHCSASTWFFMEERVWRMGVRAMMEGQSVAALERAAMFPTICETADERDRLMRNIARVVSREVEAGTATVATSDWVLRSQIGNVRLPYANGLRGELDSGEARHYAAIIVEEPTANYAYILSVTMAYFHVDNAAVFAQVEAVVRDPKRTEQDRIAAAAHLGLLSGGSGVGVGLPEPELTAYRTVAELFAAEQVGRRTDYYDRMQSYATITPEDNEAGRIAREAFTSGDVERIRGAIAALTENRRVDVLLSPWAFHVTGLGKVASEYPALRKDAMAIALHLNSSGPEFDGVILAGLKSSDGEERLLAIRMMRSGTPPAEAWPILERIVQDAAADPLRRRERELAEFLLSTRNTK